MRKYENARMRKCESSSRWFMIASVKVFNQNLQFSARQVINCNVFHLVFQNRAEMRVGSSSAAASGSSNNSSRTSRLPGDEGWMLAKQAKCIRQVIRFPQSLSDSSNAIFLLQSQRKAKHQQHKKQLEQKLWRKQATKSRILFESLVQEELSGYNASRLCIANQIQWERERKGEREGDGAK